MRLPMNVRRIATVTVVCGALVAGGFVTAWGRNDDRHDKPGHHQKLTQHYEHKHSWGYLYKKIESLTGRLNTLSARISDLSTTLATSALANSVNASVATLTGQYSTLMGQFTTLTSQFNTLDTSLTSLTGRMGNFDKSIVDLNQRIADVNASIANLATSLNRTVDDLTGRVAQLEAGGGAGGGLSVVDGTGAKLGDFVGFDPISWGPLVGISDNGHTFVLRVYPERLRGNPVYFESMDCIGRAFVAPFFVDDRNPTNSVSLAGLKGNTVYVTEANVSSVDAAGQFILVTVASEVLDNGGCLNKVQSVTAFEATQQMQLVAIPPFIVR